MIEKIEYVVDRIISLFKPSPSKSRKEINLDIAIENVRNSWKRRSRDLHTRYPMKVGMCCPGCAYGAPYREACDHIERTTFELVRLLRKRGRPEDMEEALWYECEYPAVMRRK
jgi:hypothetical protein